MLLHSGIWSKARVEAAPTEPCGPGSKRYSDRPCVFAESGPIEIETLSAVWMLVRRMCWRVCMYVLQPHKQSHKQ